MENLAIKNPAANNGAVTRLVPGPCRRCGGSMRLIGSEPHPVEAHTDLLTFSCGACEEFLLQPITRAANSA